MTETQPPPATCRALVCPGVGQPPTLQTIPTPDPTHGSIVVHILACSVEPGTRALISGENRAVTLPTPPYVPGGRAIGRVAATGPDTLSLAVGQLVALEPFIRGRDDTDVQILWGVGMFGSNPMGKKLMDESWRNGMFSEYVRAPLENCHALNEKVLLGSPAEGGLGYSFADLSCFGRHAIAYGGLRGIDLKAGETIIVAPATGALSSAAVEVATAMGARVIAVGRDLSKLRAVAAANSRISIVQLKGNFEDDLASLKQFGKIDAYIDISPGVANESTHVRSCIMAVKQYGRVSLMGVIMKDIAVPYAMAVLNNLTIRGQYMYEREDVKGLIKLVETGVLRIGKSAGHEIVGQFKLDDWEEAFDTAKEKQGAGKVVVIAP